MSAQVYCCGSLFLLRVRPGHLDATVQGLRAQFPNLHLSLIVGPYDILGVARGDMPALIPQDGLLYQRRIPFHSWGASSHLDNVLQQELLRLSLVRYHTLVRSSEVAAELRLAEFAQDSNGLLLGLQGWPTAALIAGSDRLDHLLAGATEDFHSLLATRRCPDHATTLLAVNMLAIEEAANLDAKWPLESTVKARVFLDLSCPVSRVAGLRSRLAKPTKSGVTTTFGVADIHVSYPLRQGDCLGRILNQIRTIRKSCATDLYSTESRIAWDQAHAPRTDDTMTTLAPIDVAPWSAATMTKVCAIDEEASAFVDCHESFRRAIASEEGSSFVDLIRFFQWLPEHLLSLVKVRDSDWDRGRTDRTKPMTEREKNEERRRLMDYAYRLLYMAQTAMVQRGDSMGPLRPIGVDTTPFPNGLRRRLHAAEAVPHSICASLGTEWPGFVVSGRYRDAFSTVAPIVTIPAEDLAWPQRWWVLIHETMHSFVQQFSADFNTMKTVISMHLSASECGAMFTRPTREVAEDCVCDALEAQAIEALGWRDYVSLSWRYFCEHGRPEDTCEHLIRTFFAVAARQDDQPPPIADQVLSWVEKCATVMGHALDGGVSGAAMAAVAGLDLNATKILRDDAPKRWPNRQHRKEWLRESAPVVRQQLRAGKPVPPKQLRYPDLYIAELARQCMLYDGDVDDVEAVATQLSMSWWFENNVIPLLRETTPQPEVSVRPRGGVRKGPH